MHPLLVSGAALAIYLVGWVPLAALLVYVLGASGNLGWEASAAIVIPACVVYAFVCLSPWYLVRMTPLRSSAVTRILTTNFGAAIGGSILLLAIARGTAVLLSRFAIFPSDILGESVDQRFRPHAPLVFGMGVLLYLLSAGMHYALASIEESKEALNREMQALVAARDAELKALKAQINPHFLFNSLNSISALAGIDAARAREMYGGQSNTFGFSASAATSTPSISSISPANPTSSGSNQTVTVYGSQFQSGLTVTVGYSGGSSTLSGSQIQSVTANSFQMIILLNNPGSYTIRVNNPDGGQSNPDPEEHTSELQSLRHL